MHPTSEPSRLFRFTNQAPELFCEATGESGPAILAAPGRLFRILGPVAQPGGEGHRLCGELYGGFYDGLRFLLPPGSDLTSVWSVIVEDA